MRPDITIITVVKNNIRGITKTIESIQSQSFKNYEHIIIDSNSTDGTSAIIKKKLNTRTIHLREKDSNIYEGINKAIKKAKSDFVGLLHSGDIFYSNNTLKYISNNLDKSDFLFGNIAYFKGKKINRLWKFKSNTQDKINPFKIPHTSLFIKKKVLEYLNLYDESFIIASDTDFLIRLCKSNFKCKKLDNYIVFMESGGLSFSVSNFFKKTSEDFSILFKHYKLFFIFFYFYKILIKFNGFLWLSQKKELKAIHKQFLLNISKNS